MLDPKWVHQEQRGINRAQGMDFTMSGLVPAASARKLLLTFAPALALTFASLGAAVAFDAAPRTPRQVAAVFPPWWSPARVFAAASEAGAVTAIGGASNIVIVVADDDQLPARLNAAGALLQLNPSLTGLCAEDQNDV